MAKKLRIVRTKYRSLVAIHVRKQARYSRFAIGDKKSRVVFHKAKSIPRAIHFLVFASRDAVVLETRFDVRSRRKEVIAQVIAFAFVRNILEELAVFGMPRVARLATPRSLVSLSTKSQSRWFPHRSRAFTGFTRSMMLAYTRFA